MSFQNDDNRIGALIKFIGRQHELNLRTTLAQQRFNLAITEFLIKKTTFATDPEGKAMLDNLAKTLKEAEAFETELILKNLLPPLPPGNTGGPVTGP